MILVVEVGVTIIICNKYVHGGRLMQLANVLIVFFYTRLHYRQCHSTTSFFLSCHNPGRASTSEMWDLFGATSLVSVCLM